MESDGFGEGGNEHVASGADHGVIRPDHEGLLVSCFESFDIVERPDGVNQRLPSAGLNVSKSDGSVGVRMFAGLRADPPGGEEDHDGNVAVEAGGNGGDLVGELVDKVDYPASVVKSARNRKSSIGVDEVNLHVNEKQNRFDFVSCRGCKSSLGTSGHEVGGASGIKFSNISRIVTCSHIFLLFNYDRVRKSMELSFIARIPC